MTDARRALPSVDLLLRDPDVTRLLASAPRAAVVAAVREAVAAARGRAGPPDDWAGDVAERLLRRSATSLRPVLNGTGVILHTNLGRAPLAPAAVAAISAMAGGYTNLELDLASGARGSRGDHGRASLAKLAGSADALVVNNAAGALVLALNTLAQGGDVAISRGELIEIGGSFRIPDILARSGARLREVGTTNRTHLEDYRAALGDGAAAVLVVHRSNFEQRGFVTSPSMSEVAKLAHAKGVPCIYDVGSGLVVDLAPWGFHDEPMVRDAVESGADLVLFSGDKLFGGPQAGLIAGNASAVDRCRRNPLARALRADKLTLAALDATLALYADEARALREIPVLAMLTAPADSLAGRAGALARACPDAAHPSLQPGMSAVGGGSFPSAELPTTLVALDPGPLGADGLALRLRLGHPAVVARVAGGRVLLDPRTLPDESFDTIGRAVTAALADET